MHLRFGMTLHFLWLGDDPDFYNTLHNINTHFTLLDCFLFTGWKTIKTFIIATSCARVRLALLGKLNG